MILREFPGLDEAPYPYSDKIIARLERALEEEVDDEVLNYMLSAIGWQCHPDAIDVLLRYADYENDETRYVVASSLCMGVKNGQKFPRCVVNALVVFADDPYRDVRWSVFFDISEYPDVYKFHAEELRNKAALARNDIDPKVRTVAEKAFDGLSKWVEDV